MENRTDAEIIKEIMYRLDWKQKDVAAYLGLTPARITQVVRHGQPLGPPARKLLVMLLEDRLIID